MTTAAPLSFGCTFSDRIEALLDGRVSPRDCPLTIHCVEPQALFNRTLKEQPFDIAELSMGSHIAAVAAGRDHYVGLPVFLSRSFRHSNLFIRTDRGIDNPADLAGKTIGLVDFQQTAALWLRGILADDHDVAASSIRWITAGLHAPVLTDRMPGVVPPGISISRSASTLDAMLAAGEIDAVISPTVPRSARGGAAPVARLWPDYRATELDYWQRTGIFPIMHVVVIRRAIVEARPDVPRALMDAFSQALTLATADAETRDFPKLALPWLIHHAAESRAALRANPWSYGLRHNRTAIDTMLRYARADGLCGVDLTPSQLFTPV